MPPDKKTETIIPPEGKENKGSGEDYKAKFEELSAKQENLNKGIAKYRDEAQAANIKVAELETKLNELNAKIEFRAEDENIDLSKEDQERLEVWARKQGFLTRDELDAERQKTTQETIKNYEAQAINEFLEKHPEYDSDEAWGKIRQEFSSGFYRTPSSLEGYRKLFEKIHKDLSSSSAAIEEGKNRAKAEIQNKGRLSLGGGSQKTSAEKETINSLQEKYPHLSKEQIEERMSEINSMYGEKK